MKIILLIIETKRIPLPNSTSCMFSSPDTGANLLKSEKWNQIDWLTNARELVNWIQERSSDDRIMLFLRHSHREVIKDHSEQFNTGLTDLGKNMAYEMGTRLPTNFPTKIWFSFVPRCYETAEEISQAIEERGGKIIEKDNLPILVAPEFNDEAVWENLQPDGKNVHEFVNKWAEGEFGNMIQNFDEYREILLGDTLERLKKEETPMFHIHVTHDLAIMALKRILVDEPLTSQDREPFLGGIGITIKIDGLEQFISKRI
ncbi:MAG: hypothetical protein GF411_18630 [Candidatus Lokiarchaeota archaeon]|nr:hypothetical protein [Candidatus Lokiarchaeota archaeon]